MASLNEQYAELRNEGKQVVAVRQDWTRAIGHTSACWLCQAVYTQFRAGPRRWWFKRILADRDKQGRILPPRWEGEQSFEFETGQTRSQQEGSRRKLKELGVLKERRALHSHRRLEYMIDFDRLTELSKEWADAERRASANRTQGDALVNEESCVQQDEISRSSTEKLDIFKGSKRTSADAGGDSESATHVDEKSLSRPASKPSKRYSVEAGGITCWFDDERLRAASLADRFGVELLQQAVTQIELAGKIAYLSTVEKSLAHPTTQSLVEHTAQNLSTYDVDASEYDRRVAAQKAVRLLAADERETFMQLFLTQHPSGYQTSFNRDTRNFGNLGEKLEFYRWLEKQFMPNRGPGRQNRSPPNHATSQR